MDNEYEYNELECTLEKSRKITIHLGIITTKKKIYKYPNEM